MDIHREIRMIPKSTIAFSLQPSIHIRRISTPNFMSVNTFEPSYVADSTLDGITPIQQFEPVLNTPAATSFIIIAIVFTLLQLRINAVSSAAKRRSTALEELRKIESLQLSEPDGIEDQVNKAKLEYETALRNELDLRTIIPGVRIVAPGDPKRDAEERANAMRFLGWTDDEFGITDDDDDNNVITPSLQLLEKNANGNSFQQQDEKNGPGLSNSSKLILGGVASTLILLLIGLTFLDPMLADQVFTAIEGSPPSDMPLSSWSYVT